MDDQGSEERSRARRSGAIMVCDDLHTRVEVPAFIPLPFAQLHPRNVVAFAKLHLTTAMDSYLIPKMGVEPLRRVMLTTYRSLKFSKSRATVARG
jgi:hypothetical protein